MTADRVLPAALARLHGQLEAGIARALAPRARLDVVAEAMAALDAVARVSSMLPAPIDVKDTLAPETVRALVTKARRAAMGRVSGELDEATLARAYIARGLRWLEGANEGASSPAGHDKPVAERALLGLLRGELDGFRASEVAHEVSRHAGARKELLVLVDVAGAARAEPLLRLAADGPSPLRDPAGGKPVGKAKAGSGAQRIELEAVAFADGVVAIYASRPVTLALEAEKGAKALAKTVAIAPGYLEVELARATRSLKLRAGPTAIELVVRARR